MKFHFLLLMFFPNILNNLFTSADLSLLLIIASNVDAHNSTEDDNAFDFAGA